MYPQQERHNLGLGPSGNLAQFISDDGRNLFDIGSGKFHLTAFPLRQRTGTFSDALRKAKQSQTCSSSQGAPSDSFVISWRKGCLVHFGRNSKEFFEGKLVTRIIYLGSSCYRFWGTNAS
jgi:hypothetical protein